MADTAIAISQGAGTNVDTRTEDANGNHRQVVVIGDPATNVGVAPVDVTYGLGVDVKRIYYYDVETSTFNILKGGDGALHVLDYHSAVGMGQIAGHVSFRGYGQRSSLSTIVSGDDVWEGTSTTCPFPSSAGEQMTIVSTSTSDSSGGIGIQTIDIHYIDATGNAQTETIIMNGTTPVNTVATNMRFIQSIHTQTVGTNAVAVGSISIYKTGSATTVYQLISPGGNMSLNSARMVPLGKSFYMTNLSVAGTSNKPLSVRLRATSTFEDVLTTGLFFLFKDVTFLQNSTREKTFRVPLKFPALSIIKATTYSTQVGGDVSVNYDGWIE